MRSIQEASFSIRFCALHLLGWETLLNYTELVTHACFACLLLGVGNELEGRVEKGRDRTAQGGDSSDDHGRVPRYSRHTTQRKNSTQIVDAYVRTREVVLIK